MFFGANKLRSAPISLLEVQPIFNEGSNLYLAILDFAETTSDLLNEISQEI